MSITVKNFIEEFKENKIENTKANPTAVEDFIREKLKIRNYIPFIERKEIVGLIVENNIKEEYGIKKVDSVNQFVSFIIAMLIAHTDLQIDAENSIEEYDLLCEAGLLEPIIAQFQHSYAECEILLKMITADILEDNNINAVVARFLDGILDKIDGLGDGLKTLIGSIDLNKILGGEFKQEDLQHLKGFLDTFNK